MGWPGRKQGEKSTKRYHATKSREVGVNPLKKRMALVKFSIFKMPEGIYLDGSADRKPQLVPRGQATTQAETVLLA